MWGVDVSEYNIVKYGYNLPVSLESLIVSGPRRGHAEPYTMTPEERKERKRAKKLLKELERNPWILWSYEGPELLPKKTSVWVWDE